MSNLLSEAIIDAKALREAALKSAETAVIEKYSQEVKDTLDVLLEQEEGGLDAPMPDLGGDAGGFDPLAAADEPTADPALGGEEGGNTEPLDENDDIPLAATDGFSDLDGKNLKNFPDAGEEVEVTIDLGALQEAVAQMSKEINESTEYEFSAEDLSTILSEEDSDSEKDNDDGDDEDERCDYIDCDGDGNKPRLSEEDATPGTPEDDLFDTEEAGGEDASGASSEGSSSAEAETATASGIEATSDSSLSKVSEGEELEEYMGGAHQRFKDSDDAFYACVKAKEDDGLSPQEARKKCAADPAHAHPTYENLDVEALTDAIIEKLTVDTGATLSGWAGRSSEDMKWELEKALAHRRSTDVEEELKDLKKAHEDLVFENKQVVEQNSQYKQAVDELKESLQDVNLSNARLLYTNRILRNTSLNERQKQKIVEAISNAGSVTEARTIFDTLQSTVEAAPRKSPQSLSEAITRRSSTIRASRDETPSSDPVRERMKRLAGIK